MLDKRETHSEADGDLQVLMFEILALYQHETIREKFKPNVQRHFTTCRSLHRSQSYLRNKPSLLKILQVSLLQVSCRKSLRSFRK